MAAELRQLIEPLLAKLDIQWSDSRVQEALGTTEAVQHAVDDPVAFIQSLLSGREGDVGVDSLLADIATAAAPMAIRLAIAQLRPKLEPHLLHHDMKWEDALPALELIDTMEEVQAAIADPEAFLAKVMAAAGPVAIKLLIAKLRP
eukprot:SAG31_NODE_4731_length_2995_cov_3.155732_3_plen_145_part_01